MQDECFSGQGERGRWGGGEGGRIYAKKKAHHGMGSVWAPKLTA